MIDWNKPIVDGFGNKAYAVKLNEEAHLVNYFDVGDCRWRVDFIKNGDEHGYCNKPDSIELADEYLAIYEDGSVEFFQKHEDACVYGRAVTSVSELLSGKFKDGIPVGYGLEGE